MLPLFSCSTRRGYTLIEVLVALAIIAVLAGLTLAGVQRVRAAAARSQCQNNLHQIAIATQNYHATYGRLPTGVTSPDDSEQPYPYMNWHTYLLPFLERPELWEQAMTAFKASQHFTQQPPHAVGGVAVPVFTCPADGRTAVTADFGGQRQGLTSYLGVAGRNTARHDGLLYLGSKHRLADATDGTSTTLLIGERPPSPLLRFGWWYAGLGQIRDGDGDGVLGVRTFYRGIHGMDCPEGPYSFTPGQITNPCDTFHFWSVHSGGANFVFADGSVRFLRYSADPIMPALATRAGGESAVAPD